MRSAVFPARMFSTVVWMLLALLVSRPTDAMTTPDREVILGVPNGGVSLPPGQSAAALTAATFQTQSLPDVLTGLGVDSLFAAFPNAPGPDVLGYDANNQPVMGNNYSGFFVIRVPLGLDRDSVVAILAGTNGVVSAEANRAPVPDVCSVTPIDPGFSAQWNFHDSNNPLDDIGAERAWCITQGSPDVTIALLDGGVPAFHSDLLGRVYGDAGYATSGAYLNHGLYVAGVMAARGQVAGSAGAFAIAGMDWNARIYSKRIDNVNVDQQTEATLIAAAVRAAIPQASIINYSSHDDYASSVRALAWADAYKANLLTVASAGNKPFSTQPDSLWYPVAYPQGVLGVGASQRTASGIPGAMPRSNCGLPQGTGVMAPGDAEIPTLTLMNSDGYTYVDGGTSLSAGMISGVASLMKAYARWLYNDDIQHLLQRSGSNRVNGQPQWANACVGWGLVRADSALGYLRPPYTVVQATAGIGGTPAESTTVNEIFYGVAGLTNGGTYTAKRYRITKAVSFPIGTVLDAWGRGALNATVGAGSWSTYMGTGWCGVVGGSLTSSGCTLETYAYRVGGMWVPTDPAHVIFGYSVLGVVPSSQVPPATVSDIGADAVSTQEAWLAWTEVGGDGYTGQAKQYDLRVSCMPITSENAWQVAPSVLGVAAAPGQLETVKWPCQLVPHTTYYCAVKVQDYDGNWSGLSNVAHFATLRSGGGGLEEACYQADGGAETRALPFVAANLPTVRYTLHWDAAADTSQLMVIGTASGSGEAPVIGDIVSVTHSESGNDTAAVSTATTRLGLSLRPIPAALTLGPTWRLVALGDTVLFAGSDTTARVLVGMVVRDALGLRVILPSDWSTGPSLCGAGDTLLARYVRAQAAPTHGQEVWCTLVGDSSQAALAGTRPAPSNDGPGPPRLDVRIDWASAPHGQVVIMLAVPKSALTRVQLFDVAGRSVQTLAHHVMNSGNYVIRWDGHGDGVGRLPTGLYFCRVTSGQQQVTSKFVLRLGR